MKTNYISPKKVHNLYFDLKTYKTKIKNNLIKPKTFTPKTILRKKKLSQNNTL